MVAIVHNLAEAKSALEKGERVLQSAPDAIFHAGSRYLLEMFNTLQAACPQANATCILDCADAWGETIAAMQDGHRNIISRAPAEVRAKLKSIALQKGVNFIEIDP